MNELKSAIERAKGLAGASGTGVLDVQHLGLAALAGVEGPCRVVLESDCAIDLGFLVQKIEAAMPRFEDPGEGDELPFSPEVQKLLEDMIALHRADGADDFGFHHMMAALFASEHRAWRVFLGECGIDGDLVSRLIIERGAPELVFEIEQIDVFASATFRGNPAAVVILPGFIEDDLMQAIAAENNLSETAFVVEEDAGTRLRWFTPTTEVSFCGHATVAAARVLFDRAGDEVKELRFATEVGELCVRREGDRLVLEGPRLAFEGCERPKSIDAALGAEALDCFKGEDDLVIMLAGSRVVEELAPDLAALAKLPHRGIIVTAKGEDCDFVSRFFGPAVGVPEDPATGSAHCLLAPIWAEKLGKDELEAKQLSARGGELHCRVLGDRVEVSGETRRYLRGKIRVPRSVD